MRSLGAVLLLVACSHPPSDGTCPAVGALVDAPPCASGTCPDFEDLSCATPSRSARTCHLGSARYDVEVDADGAVTSLYRDVAGDVVAVSLEGDFGDGCAPLRWWGVDLTACVVDTITDPPACDTDDTDPADTDPGDTDPVDTDTDLPPGPSTCFLTPLTSAPPCTTAGCPRFTDVDACLVPHLGDVETGTCSLPGRGTWQVTTWVATDGTIVTMYGDALGTLIAWVDDAPGPACRHWWGPDLSGCEVSGRTTLAPVDCDRDTAVPPDTDTDTGPLDSGSLLDTAGGWPVAWTEPGDLVVTELHMDPYGCADLTAEFVEIRNVGPHPVDLRGLRLSDDVATSVVGTSYRLARGAYAVGARTSSFPCPTTLIFPDFSYARGQELLADEGGVLRLQRFDGVDLDVVDFTGWRVDPAGTPDFVVPSGRSLQLLSGFETAAGNDDAAHWCAGEDLFPDPIPTDSTVPELNFGSPGSATATCWAP